MDFEAPNSEHSSGQPGELFGWVSGWLVAPLFGVVSFARRARTFHPRGTTLRASVQRHPEAPARLRALVDGWEGRALVRFSGALWKRTDWLPDVLGCAVRLHAGATPGEPSGDAQDLLFATVRRPWSLALAPFTTRVRDYLDNDYYAVSPFDLGSGQRAYLRLHPVRHVAAVARGKRSQRLARALEHGARLELALSDAPKGPWQPLADIQLMRVLDIDDEALRFNPFRDGRGVRPVGFVHALRRGAYGASQRARGVWRVRQLREIAAAIGF